MDNNRLICCVFLISFLELPIWTTGHIEANGTADEWYLRPVAIYRDPFRQGNHILVYLCFY